MSEQIRPIIRILNEENRGTISTSPTIMFHIQGSNVSYLTVDIYLDSEDLCFDSFTFNTYAWDFITFKQYTYTPSADVWSKIYNGSHKIIFTVTDSNKQTETAYVTFTRKDNPMTEGSEQLVPSRPSYGDNELVKFGLLSCTRRNINAQVEKTIEINQFTSYGFCTPNDFFDSVFDSVYTDDYFGEYDTIITKRGKRDSNGWLQTPVYQYNERVFFTHTTDEIKKWSWVKTTLPDETTVFIATTAAPTDFLHPTTKVNLTMDGQNYQLRCLSQKEWMSIDKFTLEKIDFGNFAMNSWHAFNVITSTPHTSLDESMFSTEDERKHYYNYLIGNHKDNYVTMSYVNQNKSNATGWKEGWRFATPVRPDYDDGRYDVFWIPVLELINDPPVIELPDINKENPVVYL